MKVMQNIILHHSFFAVLLLFTVYGCKTTDNTTNPEQPVSNLKPESINVDTQNARLSKPQTSPVKMETTETGKSAKIDEESLAAAKKNMIGRWSELIGHGGVASRPSGEEATTKGKPVDKITGSSEETDNRPFIELEKKLYGKWINKRETESYEFLNDGTVIIIVTSQRGMSQKLKGNYKLVEEGRIRIDFKGDFFASRMPPSHFKISISANEFTLTDEPKGPGKPYGAATKYNRIK